MTDRANPFEPKNPAAEPLGSRTQSLLFGLAAGGVCRATGVTTGAVRSYRTISPLPGKKEGEGKRKK